MSWLSNRGVLQECCSPWQHQTRPDPHTSSHDVAATFGSSHSCWALRPHGVATWRGVEVLSGTERRKHREREREVTAIGIVLKLQLWESTKRHQVKNHGKGVGKSHLSKV